MIPNESVRKACGRGKKELNVKKIIPIKGMSDMTDDMNKKMRGCLGCGWIRNYQVYEVHNSIDTLIDYSVRLQCKAISRATEWFLPKNPEGVHPDKCTYKGDEFRRRERIGIWHLKAIEPRPANGTDRRRCSREENKMQSICVV